VLTLLTLLTLFAALAFPQAARAEPPGTADWVYEFADFTATPATTDYDHRTVTLTGELLRHRSYGGPVEPAAGEQVDLVQSAGGSPSDGGTGTGGGSGGGSTGTGGRTSTGGPSLGSVTTDGTGRFELLGAEIDQRPDQVADPVPGPFTVTVTAVHQSDPRGSDGAGDDTVQTRLAVTATPSTARLTVAYQLSTVTGAGRIVTAQGVLERDTPLGRRPVEGTAVTVEYRTAGADPLVRNAVTGSDGRFSVAFTATADGTASTSAHWSADPYLDLDGTYGLTQQVAVTSAVSPPPPATTGVPPTSARPADHTGAAKTVPHSTAPSSLTARPTTAEPKPVRPSDEPRTLAVTGGGTSRVAFLTGGITMLAAGLLLMVVRRRIRVGG